MRPNLRRRPRPDVLLHLQPVLSVVPESFQEPLVLLISPAAPLQAGLLFVVGALRIFAVTLITWRFVRRRPKY